MDNVLYLLIPFLGTTLGAACVLFLKNELNKTIHRILLGFASGVMVAASIWSLLIPALDQSEFMGKFAFVPAVVGFLGGIFFLLILDQIIPHLHSGEDSPEGIKANLKKSTMMVLAVTLHNIPEGMAVGVVFAALLNGGDGLTMSAALALCIGIAIQNFPEGAIISLPLRAQGLTRAKAFVYGLLSGIVEPIASFITILLSSLITPVLPYMLAFAAGAMMYVVVEELIPEMSQDKHSNVGTIAFAIGFSVMMVLDVALG